VSALAVAHPTARIAVWAGDEHRIGLRPIIRAVWYRQGHRPRAVGRARYQWLYVYAFVHPATGQTYWLLLPTVSVAHFSRALAEFAQAMGVGPDFQVVLVIDRAGWHTSPHVTVPDGLSLVFLPAYSPELQPAERLWALSDAPLANRPFTDLAELETVQAERCQTLYAHPEWVTGPRFAWWPQPLAPSVA
jgi:hypothetical protein